MPALLRPFQRAVQPPQFDLDLPAASSLGRGWHGSVASGYRRGSCRPPGGSPRAAGPDAEPTLPLLARPSAAELPGVRLPPVHCPAAHRPCAPKCCAGSGSADTRDLTCDRRDVVFTRMTGHPLTLDCLDGSSYSVRGRVLHHPAEIRLRLSAPDPGPCCCRWCAGVPVHCRPGVCDRHLADTRGAIGGSGFGAPPLVRPASASIGSTWQDIRADVAVYSLD